MKNSALSLSVALLFLSLVTRSAHCQSSVSGRVQEATGKPVSYANVVLLAAHDSSLVKAAMSGETGTFILETAGTGQYLLCVSMLGYLPHYALLQVSGSGQALNMGTIHLKESSQHLAEVVVEASKMLYEQKIDRLVMNVASSPVLVGGTAWDVLKRSPGLTVDEARGSITMNGKNGVLVLINGKPTNASMEVVLSRLRGMAAGNIERIEFLQSPPAQYDAEGNAGAINIVLKKSTGEGLNGTVGVAASYGRFDSGKGSLDFNWRRGRVNLYGNASITEGMGYDMYLEHDRSFVVNNVAYASSNQQFIHHSPQRNQGIQLGLDYELSAATTLGLIGNLGYNEWGMRSDSRTIGYAGSALTDSIVGKIDSKTVTTFAYGNANLTHRFNPRHEVSLDADYAYYLLTNPGHTSLEYVKVRTEAPQPDILVVDKRTPFHIWVGKGDYNWYQAEGRQLSMGLKLSHTQFENQLKVNNTVDGRQEELAHLSTQDRISEQTYAAYASAHFSPAPSWSMQTGLRYEYNIYRIKAVEGRADYSRENGRLFPSFYVTHEVDSTRQLQFSYSRRINRPSYDQLASFYIFLDPYQVVTGNPTLLPAVTDALSLTYSRKSVFFTLRYSLEKNAILWRNIVDTQIGVQLNQQHNFDSYQVASFTVSFPVKPTPWWEIQFSTAAEHRTVSDREGREYPVHLSQANLLGNMTQTFTLPWQLKLEMIGNYITNFLDGEQTRSGRGGLDVGLQKQLKRNGGSLSLTLVDVFNSAGWMDWDFYQEEHSVRTYGVLQFSQRQLRLGYSHPFGNQGVKAAKKRSTASEEERRRAGS